MMKRYVLKVCGQVAGLLAVAKVPLTQREICTLTNRGTPIISVVLDQAVKQGLMVSVRLGSGETGYRLADGKIPEAVGAIGLAGLSGMANRVSW